MAYLAAQTRNPTYGRLPEHPSGPTSHSKAARYYAAIVDVVQIRMCVRAAAHVDRIGGLDAQEVSEQNYADFYEPFAGYKIRMKLRVGGWRTAMDKFNRSGVGKFIYCVLLATSIGGLFYVIFLYSPIAFTAIFDETMKYNDRAATFAAICIGILFIAVWIGVIVYRENRKQR